MTCTGMRSVPEQQHRNQTAHDEFLIRCRSLLLEQDVQKHPINVYKSNVSKKSGFFLHFKDEIWIDGCIGTYPFDKSTVFFLNGIQWIIISIDIFHKWRPTLIVSHNPPIYDNHWQKTYVATIKQASGNKVDYFDSNWNICAIEQ